MGDRPAVPKRAQSTHGRAAQWHYVSWKTEQVELQRPKMRIKITQGTQLNVGGRKRNQRRQPRNRSSRLQMPDIALNGSAVHLSTIERAHGRSDFNRIAKRSARSMGFECDTTGPSATSGSEQGTLGGPVWGSEARAWAVLSNGSRANLMRNFTTGRFTDKSDAAFATTVSISAAVKGVASAAIRQHASYTECGIHVLFEDASRGDARLFALRSHQPYRCEMRGNERGRTRGIDGETRAGEAEHVRNAARCYRR